MTTSNPANDAAWDAFFDFLAEESGKMSNDEIRAELRSHRINVEPTVDRIKLALQAVQAREALHKAPAKRTRLLGRLRELAVQPLEDARRDLRALLQKLGPEPIEQVYFNRLESAATDEDLQTLVEDLAAIELLDDEADDGTKQET